MNARWWAVLLLAALALVAAGCGGDDGGDSASSDTAVVETDATDDGDQATETDASDDATETDPTDDGILEGECAEFAGLSAKLSQALGGTSGDLESATGVFDELADQVPDEIRDDYEVLAENFGKLAEALKDVDLTSGATPSPEDLAKIQEVTQSLDSAEVQEASQNIEAWATENC